MKSVSNIITEIDSIIQENRDLQGKSNKVRELAKDDPIKWEEVKKQAYEQGLDFSFLDEGSRVQQYENFILSEWPRVIERQDWRWFEIGDMDEVCDILPDEKLFETNEVERLPFNYTVITSSYFKDGNPFARIVLFCFQKSPDEIEILPAFKGYEVHKEYRPLAEKGFLRKVSNKWTTFLPIEAESTFLFRPILILLKILQCTNVRVVTESFPAKVNSLRKKRGERLGIDKHVLIVKENSSSSASFGGTHSSPRLHFRRGHIRHLSKGMIWVRQCLVGRGPGFVDKDYLLVSKVGTL